MIPYTSPSIGLDAFNCPHCSAYSTQHWGIVFSVSGDNTQGRHEDLRMAVCRRCGKYSVWRLGEMIYPENSPVPPPHADLGEAVKTDYLEARTVLQKSPRSSAALLRLAIQKLCSQLRKGSGGKDLNADIASLVAEGLPVKIQQALDIVRVIGNNAVHPGQMDLQDDRETALQLFSLINLVAEVMIAQTRQIDDLYASLPESSRKAIEKRDGEYPSVVGVENPRP